MSRLEKRLYRSGYQKIAGIDEAGRGPLAGPVVAAACILPKNFLLEKLNDSKKLTALQRKKLYTALTIDPRVIYGIGIVDVKTIDQINILQATLRAMQIAVNALALQPDCLLIDGNQLPSFTMPAFGIIDGDSKSLSIAAASVIAKVTRDGIMVELDKNYPLYGFLEHKGYGTKKHLEALKAHGPCSIHRFSFEPVRSLENKMAKIGEKDAQSSHEKLLSENYGEFPRKDQAE